MSELADPLTRLNFLPTAMNWRGVWNNAFQYYKNDIVLSPTNNASYLLFGAVADRGVDPVSNADWFEVFPHTTGLEGLTAGNGISIAPVPSANNPTISNSGVRSITANTGLAWNGTTNTITNTGILGIVADPSSTSGLSWDASSSTLLNAGVVSTARIGIANSGTAQNQVWSNQGIVGLNAGANISVSVDSSGTATIGNTGVVSLSAGSNIKIGGTSTSFPTITLTNIDVNTLLTPTAGMTPNPIVGVPTSSPFNLGFVPVSLPVGNSLVPMLTNPPLDPNPTWVFDFTGWWVDSASVQGISLGVILGLRDNATAGGPYLYTFDENVWMSDAFAGTYRAKANCGLAVVPLHEIRSAGLQTITDVYIANQTGNFLTLNSWSPVLATYYPTLSI